MRKLNVLMAILCTHKFLNVAATCVTHLRGEELVAQKRHLDTSVDVYHINSLYPSKEVPYHWFGEAVEIQDDLAIIGAPGTEDFSNYGVAYIYHKESSGESWKQVAALESPSEGVYASFGASVTIYQGCAFVGAPKYVWCCSCLCCCCSAAPMLSDIACFDS